MNAIKKNTRLILHGVLLSMLLAPYSAGADDIDVFVNPSLTGVKPNILLLLDLSESMDYAPDNQPPATANDSKIAILKSAMNSILDDPHIAGKVNIGLQIFKSKYSSVGAPIIFPVADPDDDAHNYDPAIPVGTTVRQVLKNQIESAETSGNKTPILNALYESARYFRGMDIDDGSNLVGEAPLSGINLLRYRNTRPLLVVTGGSGGVPLIWQVISVIHRRKQ